MCCCCCDECDEESPQSPRPGIPRPAPKTKRTIKFFWRAVMCGLGMAQLLLAIVLFALEVTGLLLGVKRCDRITDVGAGIWCSVVFMVAGIAGVSATRAPNVLVSLSRLIVVMLFNVIAILFAVVLFGVSVNEVYSSDCVRMWQWLQRASYDDLRSSQLDRSRAFFDLDFSESKLRREFYVLRIISAVVYFAQLILGGLCLVLTGVSVFHQEVTETRPARQAVLPNAPPAPIYTTQITSDVSAQTVGYTADGVPVYRYLPATVNPLYPPAQQMPLPERPTAPGNVVYRY